MRDAVIELYEGNLGGGKSYACVIRMYSVLLKGWIVQTNLTLKWDKIKEQAKKDGYELDDKQYIHLEGDEVIEEFYKHITVGPGTMLVLDEAHLWFDQNSWKTNSKIITRVLTQTRKLELCILLITQHRKNLASTFTRMLQYIWICRDPTKYKLLGIEMPRWLFPCFIQVQTIQPQNTKIDTRYIPRMKKYFDMYESKELLMKIPIGLERPEINFKKVTGKKARFWWVKYAMMFLTVFLSYKMSRGDGNIKEEEDKGGVSEAIIKEKNTEEKEIKIDEKEYYQGIYILNGELYMLRNKDLLWKKEKIKRLESSGIIETEEGGLLYPSKGKLGGPSQVMQSGKTAIDNANK